MQASRPTQGKWVVRALYGLMLLVLISVAWWSLGEGTPEVEPAEVSAPTLATPSPRPPPPPEQDELPPAEVGVEASGEPPSEPSSPGPGLAPVSTPRPPKHPVDPELLARSNALLERARGEVKSTPETALKTLAEYKQLLSPAPPTREAELVHVEALLRLGRRQEAESLGRKLVTRDAAVSRPVERLLRDVRPN